MHLKCSSLSADVLRSSCCTEAFAEFSYSPLCSKYPHNELRCRYRLDPHECQETRIATEANDIRNRAHDTRAHTLARLERRGLSESKRPRVIASTDGSRNTGALYVKRTSALLRPNICFCYLWVISRYVGRLTVDKWAAVYARGL